MRASVVGGAACIAVLTACGGSAKHIAVPAVTHSSSPSAATSQSLTSSTAPSSTAEPSASPSHYGVPYVDGFEDFWVAYAKADELGQPGSPLLSEHAVGSALAWAHKQIGDHVKLGVAHRGIVHFRSVGAEHVTLRSALVGQCMDWSSWPVVNRTTGVTFQQFKAYSQLVSGQMILTQGRWKLSTLNVQAAAC